MNTTFVAVSPDQKRKYIEQCRPQYPNYGLTGDPSRILERVFEDRFRAWEAQWNEDPFAFYSSSQIAKTELGKLPVTSISTPAILRDFLALALAPVLQVGVSESFDAIADQILPGEKLQRYQQARRAQETPSSGKSALQDEFATVDFTLDFNLVARDANQGRRPAVEQRVRATELNLDFYTCFSFKAFDPSIKTVELSPLDKAFMMEVFAVIPRAVYSLGLMKPWLQLSDRKTA